MSLSFLPLPLGECWGEGLRRQSPSYFLRRTKLRPQKKDNSLSLDLQFLPHPRPLSQKERGENNLRKRVQLRAVKLQALTPNPSPRGRGEKSSNLVEHFLSIFENLLIG